jgi:hypothetical protein
MHSRTLNHPQTNHLKKVNKASHLNFKCGTGVTPFLIFLYHFQNTKWWVALLGGYLLFNYKRNVDTSYIYAIQQILPRGVG